jgi:hypothetical protein
VIASGCAGSAGTQSTLHGAVCANSIAAANSQAISSISKSSNADSSAACAFVLGLFNLGGYDVALRAGMWPLIPSCSC